MTVDYGRLRSTTARQMIRALESDGFTLRRQKGSHRHYFHVDGRRVTITFHHSSDSFRFKTLKSMIETQARWTEGDLRRLALL